VKSFGAAEPPGSPSHWWKKSGPGGFRIEVGRRVAKAERHVPRDPGERQRIYESLRCAVEAGGAVKVKVSRESIAALRDEDRSSHLRPDGNLSPVRFNHANPATTAEAFCGASRQAVHAQRHLQRRPERRLVDSARECRQRLALFVRGSVLSSERPSCVDHMRIGASPD
jgi:hypothetical protein